MDGTTHSVIPEVAKRLSGIQKALKSWIPDLGCALSGMTTIVISGYLQTWSSSKSAKMSKIMEILSCQITGFN
jgi:hypothetical protein